MAHLLRSSAIDLPFARSRGYRWLTQASELVELGFDQKQSRLVPGLLVPLHGVDGSGVVGWQFRPKNPRKFEKDGKEKVRKYENPTGSRTALDCNPLRTAAVGDVSADLWITEGAKKGDAAASRGLCCIALAGVWNWRRDGEPLPEWDHVPLDSRRVYVAYDSDVMVKPEVRSALVALTAFLARRGAVVRWVVLPEGDVFASDAKVGLDDYLANGNTVQDLYALATLPKLEVVANGNVYAETLKVIAGLQARNDPPTLFSRADAIIETNANGGVTVVDDRRLGLLAARDLDWIKHLEKGPVPTRPDRTILSAVTAAWDEWSFPVLDRVVSVPTFAADWTLRTDPGYHQSSRTLYRPDAGLEVPPVPDRPSPGDVADALRWINGELLRDFMFASEADRAHALALMLQPFVRDAIRGNTPLFVAEAPKQGSGKTLLLLSLLSPAHGVVDSMAEPHGDEEMEKRLTAAFMRAQPVIFFDNVTRKMNWSSLATALTKPRWEGRVLGESRGVSVPITATFVASANNPTYSDDLARRAVSLRLDTRLERPEQRRGFKHSLPEWAHAHRSELVWSCLVLTKHWLAEGRPKPPESVPHLGGYGPWRRVLGGILHSAGVPGLLGNRQNQEDGSPEAEAFQALVELICNGGVGHVSGFTAQEVRELLEHEPDLAGIVDPSGQRRGAHSFATVVGKYLRDHVGQVSNGWRLELTGKKTRSTAKIYALVQMDGPQ